MSYDVYLERVACSHCKRGPDSRNVVAPTYNLAPIFTVALLGVGEGFARIASVNDTRDPPEDGETKPCSLHVLNGRSARETIPELEAAYRRVMDPELEPRLRALEPENKWGTLEDAREVFSRMLEVARESHAECIWSIT
jgi:hypothetical protein